MHDVKIYNACVAAVPVKDTIKVVDAEGIAVNTPDRSTLWQIQTPQVFESELILEAYDKLYCDNQILFNEQIENSDIYKDKLYYTQNDGLFMYDFTYKESTLLTKEKVYFNDAVKVARYHIANNVNTAYKVMRDYGEQTGDVEAERGSLKK